jgi:hypothetical protein
MARRGWSSTNFLRYSGGVATATPVTLCAWAKTSVTGTQQRLLGLFNSASGAGLNQFSLAVSTGNAVRAQTGDGASSNAADSSTTISANTWFHACGVFASPTDRRAFLNGAGKGTETTSRTPSGINRTAAGLQDNTAASQPWAPAGTGDIAEAAAWNIALSDTDVAALATGVSPLLIHPEALVGYWPIIGNNSPENNLLSNTSTLSVQGSLSASAHPSVIQP